MLNQSLLRNFEQYGYLIVDNVLDEWDRHALRAEYAALVDTIDFQRGHVSGDWHRLETDQKLARLICRDPQACEQMIAGTAIGATHCVPDAKG